MGTHTTDTRNQRKGEAITLVIQIVIPRAKRNHQMRCEISAFIAPTNTSDSDTRNKLRRRHDLTAVTKHDFRNAVTQTLTHIMITIIIRKGDAITLMTRGAMQIVGSNQSRGEVIAKVT